MTLSILNSLEVILCGVNQKYLDLRFQDGSNAPKAEDVTIMATKQDTADYLLSKLANLEGVYARKMFGEYGIYYRDKVVAMLCDEQLFIKPTSAGLAFLKNPEYAPPYPGAKDYFLIPEDEWEDSEKICTLIQISEPEIKLPQKRKKAK